MKRTSSRITPIKYSDIFEIIDDAENWTRQSKYPHKTYEEGVIAGLMFAVNEGPDPFEYE
jgi:hypothetical protein